MSCPKTKEVPVLDLRALLHAIETLDAEVEQLEITEEWYSSDSRDLLEAAKEILHGHLGITEINYDDDDEFESSYPELY